MSSVHPATRFRLDGLKKLHSITILITSFPQFGLQIRSQLDDAIASECPYCGDLMIREISLHFLEEKDESEAWDITPQNLSSQKSISLIA